MVQRAPRGQGGGGGHPCGRSAVVEVLRFQMMGEDEEETDVVFGENQATQGEEGVTAGDQVDRDY